MSIPPAHRRLVPRRPRPTGDERDERDGRDGRDERDERDDDKDLDVTQRRPAFDPSRLELGDVAPWPGDSMNELTIERVRPDPEALDKAALRRLPAEDLAPGASFSDLEPTNLHAPSSSGIEDRPTTHLSPAESGLIAAISEGHEPSRILYADWLERRGEPARAELLRLDHALHAMHAGDPRFIPVLQRLRALAPLVSVDWRSRVSRAAIEGCTSYGVACPAYWRALPADADDVRTCPACHDKVYYCATLQLARDRVQRGQCVAIDTTCERWPRDLDRQCDGCGGELPPQHRFCPHCGRAMTRAQSLSS